MAIRQRIEQTFIKNLEGLKAALQKEYQGQGHKLSGSLIRDIKVRVKRNATGWSGEVLVNFYAQYLEQKIPPSRIPFSPGQGRGGVSEYIQGLIDYFERRGLPTREATGAAFATATVQSREGMPTRGSYRFSKNGRRTGAIKHVIENEGREVSVTMAKEIGEHFVFEITNLFR
jgi:hypothetical protein